MRPLISSLDLIQCLTLERPLGCPAMGRDGPTQTPEERNAARIANDILNGKSPPSWFTSEWDVSGERSSDIMLVRQLLAKKHAASRGGAAAAPMRSPTPSPLTHPSKRRSGEVADLPAAAAGARQVHGALIEAVRPSNAHGLSHM